MQIGRVEQWHAGQMCAALVGSNSVKSEALSITCIQHASKNLFAQYSALLCSILLSWLCADSNIQSSSQKASTSAGYNAESLHANVSTNCAALYCFGSVQSAISSIAAAGYHETPCGQPWSASIMSTSSTSWLCTVSSIVHQLFPQVPIDSNSQQCSP